MQKIHYQCDRCEATLQNRSVTEIQMTIPSMRSGTLENVSVDLCDDCYNSLVKWFGKYNRYTGLEFCKV